MSAASKFLSNLVYSYKGMGLSMVRTLPTSLLRLLTQTLHTLRAP